MSRFLETLGELELATLVMEQRKLTLEEALKTLAQAQAEATAALNMVEACYAEHAQALATFDATRERAKKAWEGRGALGVEQ